MQALVTSPGNTATVQSVSIPKPEPRQLLVRVHAIALNPVDALYVAKPASGPGRTVGSDFAGVVVDSNTATKFKVGDRVAGFLHGACQENELPGAFAELLVVDEDLVFGIPDNVAFEEAATMPLCMNTAANGLFRVLELQAPWSRDTETSSLLADNRRRALFIYSGATSVGIYAIQLARLSPSAPLIITTSSPSNADYLKSLGAHHVLSYRDNWVDETIDILNKENAEVHWALDCISEGDTVEKVSQIFEGENGGRIATVRGPTQWSHKGIKKNVNAEYMAVWTLLGKEFWYNGGIHFPAEPTHRALAASLYDYLSKPEGPLAKGELKANRVRLMQGGLDRVVEDAFPLLGVGRVTERNITGTSTRPLSGEKMVFRIKE